MSTVSDPYQPIERELKSTKRILQNMHKETKLNILTKSDFVLRDIEIFKEFHDVEVGLTINNFEGSLKKEIEPYSPNNKRRIDALKILKENGIKTYAFISPIIPDLIDIEYLIRETKDFVDFYYFEFINLKASGKEFKEWLKQRFPESYEIIVNKKRFGEYVRRVIDIIEKTADKPIKGILVH